MEHRILTRLSEDDVIEAAARAIDPHAWNDVDMQPDGLLAWVGWNRRNDSLEQARAVLAAALERAAQPEEE